LLVGIVGAGLQGRRRALALRAFHESRLMIVADLDEVAGKGLAHEMGCAATTDWREVVDNRDLDAVIVSTPNNLHEKIAVAAIREEKHVLCEKPLAMNLEEARNMVTMAENKRVVLKCGFNLRHHPAISRAHKLVTEGNIGMPSCVRCVYGNAGREGFEKEWRAKPEISGGGQLMDQGMHAIDLCRWFMGEFVEVAGFVSTTFWKIPVEDNAFALMRTNKGQIASFHASWAEWKNLFSLEILGDDGYAAVRGLGGSYGTEILCFAKRTHAREPFSEQRIEFRGEDVSLREEWQELLNAVAENRQPLGNGNDGMKALQISTAIYRSARSRSKVLIGQVTE